jgi:hypothetical protein
MKRKALLMLCAVMTFFSCTLLGPLVVNNQMTDKHVHISGTKLNMIPPAGFSTSLYFSGFLEEQTRSSVMVRTIPDPIESVLYGFPNMTAETKDLTFIMKKDLVINGCRGRLYIGKQQKQGIMHHKYILVFGDKHNSFILYALFAQDPDNDYRDTVKASLLSVVYEPEREIDSRSTTGFEIDAQSFGFRSAGVDSGLSFYTADGLIPTEAENKTTLISGRFSNTEGMQDKRLFAGELITQTESVNDVRVEVINDISLDDLSGCEVMARAKDETTEEPVFVYQLVLFGDDAYYVLRGLAYQDVKKNLDMMKKIFKTFERE